MKFFNIITGIAFLACLVGCGAPIKNNLPTHFYGKNYEIDQLYETATGLPMVTIQNAYLFPTYRLPTYRPKYKHQPKRKQMMPIDPSQKWVAFHYYENDYLLTSKEYYNGWIGIIINSNGEITSEKPMVDMRILSPNPMQHPVQHRLPIGALKDPQLFLPIEGHPRDGAFKAELVYNGIMNNIISVSYREYNNNFARPAFYQDLKYDLNEMKQITFRSIKIMVEEADNLKITFKIIDDGGLPWMPQA